MSTEGNNANKSALENLKELSLKVAKDLMTDLFPGAKVKYTPGEGMKVHVNELNEDDIIKLAAFARNQPMRAMRVNLKRSGTGITILISAKTDAATKES